MADATSGLVALAFDALKADNLRMGAEARAAQLEAENESLRAEVRTLGKIARICTKEVLGEPCAWCTCPCQVAAE